MEIKENVSKFSYNVSKFEFDNIFYKVVIIICVVLIMYYL